MQIALTVTKVTPDEIKKEVGNITSNHEYIQDLIVTNNVLWKYLDERRYEKGIVEEMLYDSGFIREWNEDYSITDVLMEHLDEIPDKISDGFNSEWSIETIELLFPKVEVKIS